MPLATADVQFLTQDLDAYISRTGRMESYMVRAGLLKDILDALPKETPKAERDESLPMVVAVLRHFRPEESAFPGTEERLEISMEQAALLVRYDGKLFQYEKFTIPPDGDPDRRLRCLYDQVHEPTVIP